MIDKRTSPHYSWGERCDGWHLVQTPTLSVIQECMPPDTAEVRHYHRQAEQFFYVLQGILRVAVGTDEFELSAGQGIYVKAGEIHQVHNRSAGDAEFLVISNPPSHGDRVSAD
jgi:mannose-6-phosphate isomerase-like protein (cupin superfamily)